eukprot:1001569-Pelagomonas_calceolata.AAC.1
MPWTCSGAPTLTAVRSGQLIHMLLLILFLQWLRCLLEPSSSSPSSVSLCSADQLRSLQAGLQMTPEPFTPLLLELKEAVERCTGDAYDTVSAWRGMLLWLACYIFQTVTEPKSYEETTVL